MLDGNDGDAERKTQRFVFLLSLSKVKYFSVLEPSSTLLSLDFLAFWVQICSIEYLCDRQQQRKQQIVSGIWKTGESFVFFAHNADVDRAYVWQCQEPSFLPRNIGVNLHLLFLLIN
ncbi:hypothetical protein GmHk_14G040813 [Glycine max]|nr:hypothetical protein GmHk_14G040813 [Glycine max]